MLDGPSRPVASPPSPPRPITKPSLSHRGTRGGPEPGAPSYSAILTSGRTALLRNDRLRRPEHDGETNELNGTVLSPSPDAAIFFFGLSRTGKFFESNKKIEHLLDLLVGPGTVTGTAQVRNYGRTVPYTTCSTVLRTGRPHTRGRDSNSFLKTCSAKLRLSREGWRDK